MLLDGSVYVEMLAGVGKLFSGVRSLYNDINPATLTGAIDVVVVEQPDGSYVSSPFHVRFGKLGVMRSKQNVVYVDINGEPTDLQMKLGPSGEAFFVQGIQEQWEGPDYMATSPITSSPIAEAVKLRSSQSDSNLKSKHTKKSQAKRVRRETEISNSSSSSASDLSAVHNKKDPRSSYGFVPISQQDDELLESGGMFEIEVDDDSRAPIPDIHTGLSKTISLPLVQESSMTRTESWAINSYHKSSQFHPFSDTDITPQVSPVGSRSPTPKSDTEYENAEHKNAAAIEASSLQQWDWGELPASSKKVAHKIVTQEVNETDAQSQDQNTTVPDVQSSRLSLWSYMRSTKSERHKTLDGGIYLDDLPERIDDEMAAIYLTSPRNRQDEPDKGASHIVSMSQESEEKPVSSHVVNMSEDDAESGHGASLPRSPVNELHSEPPRALGPSPTSESGTMRDHECGVYGDVSMSLCGAQIEDYSNVSADVFEQHLVDFTSFIDKPSETMQHSDLVVRIGGKYYNWLAAAPMIMSMMTFHQLLPEDIQQSLVKNTMSKKHKVAGRSWWPFSRGTKLADLESGTANSTPSGSPKKSAAAVSHSLADKRSESDDEADDEKEQSPPIASQSYEAPTSSETIPMETRYVKTLRLTSAELERLNLHEGENEIEFSVTTAYQGTTRCVAHIFLWKHTDKVIISDIDGTITRSDMLGHLFPMVGKDWSQSGVTELFTRISQNGYRFAYLSARAIGQAQMTRDYLKSVKQGELTLPSGPVFLNPSSLINAIHKEVIEKKPETFKISCLSDIKSLFSTDSALYAGFGNRVNDIYAYTAVGIPKSRMFLIDPNGKVKSGFSETFQSSYSHLSDVTDHHFPPVEELGGETAMHAPAEFSNFTYWREPVPNISFELPE